MVLVTNVFLGETNESLQDAKYRFGLFYSLIADDQLKGLAVYVAIHHEYI